jgi:hypothetical protein
MWHTWDRSENYTKFFLESLKRKDHSDDLGIDEKVIKMDLEKEWGVDCIYAAQNRDQWWALVNILMNLPFHNILKTE